MSSISTNMKSHKSLGVTACSREIASRKSYHGDTHPATILQAIISSHDADKTRSDSVIQNISSQFQLFC